MIGIVLACERGKPNQEKDPNAVRDLLIDRIVWNPKPVPNRPGIRFDEHQFTITNTSSQHSYRQIQVCFDYYDSLYHRISTKRFTIPQRIVARSAVAIPTVRVGVTHPLAKSATVRIERALAD